MKSHPLTRTRIAGLALAGVVALVGNPCGAEESGTSSVREPITAPTTQQPSVAPTATADPFDGVVAFGDEQPGASTDGATGGGGGGSSASGTTGGPRKGTGGGYGGGGGGGGGGFGSSSSGSSKSFPQGVQGLPGARAMSWASPDINPTPLIFTQPMEPAVQAEWKEDLAIMGRLLRGQIVRATGEQGPRAMGIPLTLLGQSGPIYIEDCGVVFTAMVTIPLAASEKSEPRKEDEKQPTPGSEWERIKSEMRASERAATSSTGDNGTVIVTGPLTTNTTASGTVTLNGNGTMSVDVVSRGMRFDQAKVDALVDALFKTLPEAKNFRHLKAGEMVIVCIAGTNDRGAPMSLTLKAKKSDIDAAADGKLSPAEFKSKVAMRIG